MCWYLGFIVHIGLEYCQIKRGINDLCLSEERNSSDWLKGFVFVFKPIRAAPLFRQTQIVYTSLYLTGL